MLQHLLGEDVTVPPDRGLFLPTTYRLRPELCAFTSDAYYEGRLAYADEAARRSLATGNGPVWLPVQHTGRGQSSLEEADAIAAVVRGLVGTTVHRRRRQRAAADRARRARRRSVQRAGQDAAVAPPASDLAVGTVDKFQGQQAPVVIVSMASSSPEDAPRGIGFAFDRHRFNVATSRAQCRAVLVCSPRLLDADCKTVGQMRLVSAVSAFVERAHVAVEAARRSS